VIFEELGVGMSADLRVSQHRAKSLRRNGLHRQRIRVVFYSLAVESKLLNGTNLAANQVPCFQYFDLRSLESRAEIEGEGGCWPYRTTVTDWLLG
jgi:hypothetical protein